MTTRQQYSFAFKILHNFVYGHTKFRLLIASLVRLSLHFASLPNTFNRTAVSTADEFK